MSRRAGGCEPARVRVPVLYPDATLAESLVERGEPDQHSVVRAHLLKAHTAIDQIGKIGEKVKAKAGAYPPW
jgi:hypothetical protein